MDFLFSDIDSESNYKYQQIYREIKGKILDRKIKPDVKLPSKRKLANQLKVSTNTITNAYEQLLAEGYIYTVERSGYYVESITQFQQGETIQNKLPRDLEEQPIDNKGWISLSHMTSDISIFPFKEWIKCEQKAITNHKEALSEISHPQGPFLLRSTISRMVSLSRGVRCEPEQIVIGAGTQLLIKQLMEIQKNKPIVAMEDPGYSRFYTLLKNMGFDVRSINLDEKGIRMEEIESAGVNYLFVTPSHQFPTGKIMPISRRIQLLNWSAQDRDRYIIEDDYDSEFKYETDNIPSLQSLDRNQRVIYTGTFSKTMLPGLRVSYMVLPPDILREYRQRHADLMQHSNSLALFTLYYFIETGEYERHIKRMNLHYEVKRKELIKQLQLRFKDNIKIHDVPAGLHFLAQFKTTKDYETIEQDAKKMKLEIYSMKRFTLAGNYKTTGKIDLVIGFATIKKEQIPEAVDKLYTILNETI
ncbi:PLP-dependent aminotransferase family protein [Virgibacillus sp. DJP39]|uniref:MocR-like transcriptional regulator GabR n=1 Tax=Virgibacillus sp. DJP39 TaxID=3409790 RepID=UPI003BB7308E